MAADELWDALSHGKKVLVKVKRSSCFNTQLMSQLNKYFNLFFPPLIVLLSQAQELHEE